MTCGAVRAAVLALVAIACSACASAPVAEARPWFKTPERPVKAVVLGGSISAYRFGGYGAYLQAVCRRLEVRNIAKSRLGAGALKARFDARVIRNRRLKPAAHEAVWLLFFGGLNSVGAPDKTNQHLAATFRAAHTHGLKTMALALAPWGSDRDRRWAGAAGLKAQSNTERVVDFVMGRLSPEEALGSRAANARSEAGWMRGELPDIAVDLWHSPLRNVAAPLRDEGAMAAAVPKNGWVRRALKGLTPQARERTIARLVADARAIPRTYMRPELQGFDAIHPNTRGHRVIAEAVCDRAPAAWGCECASLGRASWSRKLRRVVFADSAAGSPGGGARQGATPIR